MQDVDPAPIDELEDADRRVAESHARPEGAVDVLGRRDAFLDQTDGLVHQERLQAGSDESGRVGAAHRDLAELLEEGDGPLDDRARGRPPRDHLDERDDVRRIEPVHAQEALVTVHRVGQMPGRDRRAGGREDRLGRDGRRHASEDLALEVDELGQRFLHVSTRVESFEAGAILDPIERRRDLGVREHPLLGHQGEVPPDLPPRVGEHGRGAAGRAVLHVDQGHATATQREGERDLAPDPAGPEDRDVTRRGAHRLSRP